MKRLLVVSFALPPTLGSNPSRAWHLARHLPAFGWEAIVVTPRHPRRRMTVENAREHRDHSIPLRRVLDPSGASFWLQETGYRDLAADWRRNAPIPNADQDLPGLYGRQDPTPEEAGLAPPPRPTSAWRSAVAALRYVPDARAGWIGPATAAARAVAETLRPDAIYSVSPPLSAHCVASRIAADLRVPWLADLRFPWADSAHGLAGRLRGAGILRRAIRAGPGAPVDLRPSFDELDWKPSGSRTAKARTDPLVLLHAGPTAVAGRDPIPVLDAVRALIDRGAIRADAIRLRFIGANDPRLAAAIVARRLGSVATLEPAVPWEVSIQSQAEAAALLLILGPGDAGRIPDRLLEAFAVRRPLIETGPGDPVCEGLIRSSRIRGSCGDDAVLANRIARLIEADAGVLAAPVDLDEDAIAPYRALSIAERVVAAF